MGTLKIPVYVAKESTIEGKSIIERFNTLKGEYIEMPNEVYPNLEIAKERARELNKDVEPIIIQ
jgi:hypothetical protein